MANTAGVQTADVDDGPFNPSTFLTVSYWLLMVLVTCLLEIQVFLTEPYSTHMKAGLDYNSHLSMDPTQLICHSLCFPVMESQLVCM